MATRVGLLVLACLALFPLSVTAETVSKVAVGGRHTCALTTTGGVKCWGSNSAGQLGIGTQIEQHTPVDVPGLGSGVSDIAAGDAHTCAVTAVGGVKCWGYNDSGQVGIGRDGNDAIYVLAPTDVVGLASGVASIVAGYDSTCAITTSGALRCWGLDGGTGSGVGIFGHATPYDHGLASGVVAVATGSDTCVLMVSGAVKCWGYSITSSPTLIPTDVPGLPTNLVAISVGSSFAVFANCALTSAGDLKCWDSDRRAVAPPAGLSGGIAALAGPSFHCVVTISGGAKCWGYNFYGVVGDGTRTDRLTAVDVVGLTSGVASIATNSTSTGSCAVSTTGQLWCWGQNIYGQVGDGTILDRYTPSPVVGLSTGGAPTPAPSYQGLWLAPNDSESGWGLNITHQGNTLFATWFTYDLDGSGMWLVMSNGVGSGNSYYLGPLYRTTGPAFNAVPFTSIGPANYTEVGSLYIAFSDLNNGNITYTINGASRSKQISRFAFASPVPSCTVGGAPGASPNYTDLWWNSPANSESGWGVNITHQGDILFATWFTYDANGKGMWLVMSNGAKAAPGAYSGTLQRTTGPAYNAFPWNPAQVVRTTVGNATFTFTDASNGTFSYAVNGITQTKAITRLVYSMPTTVCR